jgi:hypothetical protein
MNILTVNLLFSTLVFWVAAKIYLLPRLHDLKPQTVLLPILLLHSFRHLGLHIFEDHFIPEIIDPNTNQRLPDGEMGELVFTCLTKEALPLIRYRTRDRTRLTREKCACGRSTARMERVLGRTDDMISSAASTYSLRRSRPSCCTQER